jgi:hypothetical protein
MSFQNDITCKKCGEIYTKIDYKWCKSCQMNDLKQNFTNWTSDKLIQEMQLKIKNHDDIIVEWIPYDQFIDIKKIDKDNFNIFYSAIWINGPLKYDKLERKRIRNTKVALKYLENNFTNEFFNEVCNLL